MTRARRTRRSHFGNKNMERSLTAKEIAELNELLKWVLFGYYPLMLDRLEVIMVSGPIQDFTDSG